MELSFIPIKKVPFRLSDGSDPGINITHKLLWLDDTRYPSDELLEIYNPIGDGVEVYWVRNYNEFVNWITYNGLPDGICFDYDLNYQIDPNNKNIEYHNGEISMYYLSWRDDEKTGYDCAYWLADYCIKHNYYFPPSIVHSSNQIGKENIKNFINFFVKKCQSGEIG